MLGIQIPVTLGIDSRQHVRLLAKVDSGAASRIFQREHADALGIDVERGLLQSFSTPTGRFDAYGHAVILAVPNNFEIESIVYFARQPEFPQCSRASRLA